MAADIELISTENFNSKFKNYMRDFYVYQFKHNETDFYDKGSFAATRMIAGSILCMQYDISPKEMINLQMRDIHIETDKVYVNIEPEKAKTVVILEPLSEMIRLLYTWDSSAYFLTGYSAKVISEKFNSTLIDIRRDPSLNDPDNALHYWLNSYNAATNDAIKAGSFRNDMFRLNYAISELAGVQWSKGDFIDYKKGQIDSKKENKHVECVTIDTRKIPDNPFFELYRHCIENASRDGESFSLTYALLMNFHLGKKLLRYDFTPLTTDQLEELDYCLKTLATNIEAETNRRGPSKWENLSISDKTKYAEKAIERFSREHDDLDDIYEYILMNRKKIDYINDRFVLDDDDNDFIEKNDLFRIMQHYNIRIDSKQFGNKLANLVQLGILVSKKIGQRLYYALSNVYIKDIIGADSDLLVRFSEMVSFFSQISTLGEIGCYLLDRLPDLTLCPIYYKHNYIKRALNDYNIIDLLHAIENSFWIDIEYRNASIVDLQYQKIVCFPIEIRESVTDGRQYLVFYHPKYRSVSALRIDFIDSIVILDKMEKYICSGCNKVAYYEKNGSPEKKIDPYTKFCELPDDYCCPKCHAHKSTFVLEDTHIRDDIKRAKKLVSYTWGTAFGDFQDGNVVSSFEPNRVRIVVCYNENEDFIKSRLQREIRHCEDPEEVDIEGYGHCLEFIAEVANPLEMLQWLRSYTTRIVTIEINGKECHEFVDEVIKTYEAYDPYAEKTPTKVLPEFNEVQSNKVQFLDNRDSSFKVINDMHSLLFNEIHSNPFSKTGRILHTVISHGDVDKEDLKKTYKNWFRFEAAKDRELQIENILKTFVTHITRKFKKPGDYFPSTEEADISVFTLKKGVRLDNIKDLIPLTALEVQWLHDILAHPLAKCFLTNNEIDEIREQLPNRNWFDINSVVLYDQFLKSEALYEYNNYGDTAKTIMKAIRENRVLKIKYKSQYGRVSDYICSPAYIEYSKRDNRIRVCAVSHKTVRTFNLDRIICVTPSDVSFDMAEMKNIIESYSKSSERALIIFFNEEKNVPDRILTEFSCFKKKCVKWGNNRYRMTLYYNKEDKREILVRLLSYGSQIFVFDDTGDVRNELIDRLEHQLELSNSMELVVSNDSREIINEQRGS